MLKDYEYEEDASVDGILERVDGHGKLQLDKQIFRFVHDEARRRAADYCMIAPYGWIAEFKEPTRTLEQNALLHGQLTDLSSQVEWHKQKFNPVVWKRLTTFSYLREINEKPLLIPSLDQSGVDLIYEKTSQMGVKMMTGLIEWNYSFGAEKNVIWTYK